MGETVARYLLTHYVTVCVRIQLLKPPSATTRNAAPITARSAIPSGTTCGIKRTPASPLNLNKDGSVIRVQVTAVTFFRKANGTSELAQVRVHQGPKLARCRGTAHALDRDHRVRVGGRRLGILSPGNGNPLGWRNHRFSHRA